MVSKKEVKLADKEKQGHLLFGKALHAFKIIKLRTKAEYLKKGSIYEDDCLRTYIPSPYNKVRFGMR